MLGKAANVIEFSCEGATNEAIISFDTNNEYLIKLNGQIEYKGKLSISPLGEVIPVSPYFQYIPIQAMMDNNGFEIWTKLKFTNTSQSENYRLEVISYPEDRRDPPDLNNPLDAIASFQSIAQSNSAIFYKDGMPSESSTGEPVIAYKSVAFCLSTREVPQISCAGATFLASLGFPLEASQAEEYQLKINGVLVHVGKLLDGDVYDNVGISYGSDFIEFFNKSTSMGFKTIEISSLREDDLKYLFKPIPQESGNETILFENELDGFYSKASFCLSESVE